MDLYYSVNINIFIIVIPQTLSDMIRDHGRLRASAPAGLGAAALPVQQRRQAVEAQQLKRQIMAAQSAE